MKRKHEKSLHRHELADLLEQLAHDLRQGSLPVGDRVWKVADQVEIKTSFHEKKGRFTTKLKWHWSTLDEYPDADRREIVRWKDSLKTVKKRLNSSFKILMRDVQQSNGLPDESILSDFVRQSRAFARYAEPEWQPAIEEYLDHLKNLERAVSERQPETVAHELRDIKGRMAACHREFK